MRGLPFFKPKKGAQFAGLGFSEGSGGGGGGGSNVDITSTEFDTGIKFQGSPLYGKLVPIDFTGLISEGITISDSVFINAKFVRYALSQDHETNPTITYYDGLTVAREVNSDIIRISGSVTSVSRHWTGYVLVLYTK